MNLPPDKVEIVESVMSSASAAWFTLAGILLGLLIAAGAAAWLTRKISTVITEARAVVEEMKKVVSTARGIAVGVAEHYVPLEKRVSDLEAWKRDVHRQLGMSRHGDES